MKIYTKKGDSGETGLYGGNRVPKDDLRIRTYGTMDELNAALGVALTTLTMQGPKAPAGTPDLSATLLKIQGELFQLGAELATPRGKKSTGALIEEPHVEALECEIDRMEALLPPLKSFILPGGSAAAAHLHLVRTISRRAERELVSLNRGEPQRPVILRYMNRLSDHFFVCARYANHLARVQDVEWASPTEPSAL